MSVRTKLIQIGNSRGVRLPKAMILQAGLVDNVELEVRADGILLRPASKDPRAGWDESFRQAIAARRREEDPEFWQDVSEELDELDERGRI